METVSWYMKEKASAARWSRGLRVLSVLLAVAGGLVPLVHAARPSLIGAEWGFVLLGSAGGAQALDRLFGWSTSYTRYVSTAFAVQRALAGFESQWVQEQARLAGRPPAGDEIDALLRIAAEFTDRVLALVEQETASWAGDLKEELTRLERSARNGKGS
jgi:hypothetical protein